MKHDKKEFDYLRAMRATRAPRAIRALRAISEIMRAMRALRANARQCAPRLRRGAHASNENQLQKQKMQ